MAGSPYVYSLSLYCMLYSFLFLNLVDYFQTIFALKFSGFREMNGLMSILFSFPFPIWLSFGLVKFGFSFVLYRVWSLLSSFVKWVFFGFVLFVVVNNFYLIFHFDLLSKLF